MKTKRMVAAIQMASGPNVTANLLEAERLIREAVEDGAGLVVLPETFAFKGKRDHDQLALREEPGEGPLQAFLTRVAARYGTWLVGGTIPIFAEDPNRLRAATLVFDDHGRLVGRYDKIHLFDVSVPGSHDRYEESATIEPGDRILVLDSPFGRLGVAVCYDLRFPEIFRSMLDEGMDLLAIPSSFTAITGKAHWETLVRARAIENLAYVIAAAQGGYHMDGRETHGHSMIVDPWGTILAQIPRGTGHICATLDQEYQASVRRTFPSTHHRRLKCRL
ncbi:carbon-nitrogen hydrolase family protein [Thioalkalicoccus limnaeus]|uniref:Carbon-nitrogen hydrolase family protein n=1 Tax=Thioalkalicoccus limnaeus TaxID=120681 RepID=A0ABV4BGI7_9GAMM